MTDENKSNRVSASTKFLKRFKKEGDDFMRRVITTDETWLYMYDPETKEQSCQWKNDNSPPSKKARVYKSVGKQMYIYFMDQQEMILQHAVPTHKTVNAEYYTKVS